MGENVKHRNSCDPSAFDDHKHGDEVRCPTCGAPGRLDTAENRIAEFKNSVWWNSHEGSWECGECFLK